MNIYDKDIDPYRLAVEFDEEGNIVSLSMPRPSNFHAHLRSEELMDAVAREIMVWVKYLLVMPNTGPIDTISKMLMYHDILSKLAVKFDFEVEFVMTLYFTDQLTPKIIEKLPDLPFKCAVKYYPPVKGATTGSGAGIPLQDAPDILWAMSDCRIRLLLHGESVHDKDGHELPHSKREEYFIQNEYPWVRGKFLSLLVCVEHISTKRAVDAVLGDTSGKTVATVTPPHLLFTVDDYEQYSWRNHLRAMPCLKTAADRAALVEFVTSGDKRAILGDDTAPHPSANKAGAFENAACGAWLPHSLSLYALAFKRAGALDENFVRFACLNGPDWWGLDRPDPDDIVRVVRETEHDIPEPVVIQGINDVVIPLGWSDKDDQFEIGHALSN